MGEIPPTGMGGQDRRQFLIAGLAQRYAAITDELGNCVQHSAEIADCCRLLKESAGELYTRLQFQDQYTAALQEGMNCSPRENQLWCYYLLGASTHIRIGMLSIFRASPIPIHDHPAAFGALYSVSGKTQVSQYDIVRDASSETQTVVTLTDYGKEELGAGDCSTFLPDHRNIHALESLTPRSILISLKIHPNPEPERHWYYLADLFASSKSRIYTRIKRRGRIISR